MSIYKIEPVIDYSVRNLCKNSYHNHKYGCPNFGKRKNCPPEAKLFDKVYDLNKPIYAIANKFNFKKHIADMKKKHPKWTKYQLRCCLYWQGRARKQLKELVADFLREHKNYIVTSCPEAMGVNITETMKQVGIILEWPPENYTYQIVLAGILRKE